MPADTGPSVDWATLRAMLPRRPQHTDRRAPLDCADGSFSTPLGSRAGIALWLVDLDGESVALGSEGIGTEGPLSPPEEARAARFVFERDRRRYRAAHLALRRLLAAHTGLPLPSIAYALGPNGKPALAAPGTGCRFNLSDCAGSALIGIDLLGADPPQSVELPLGDECMQVSIGEIGVDLEQQRTVPDALALAASLFTEAERAELACAPDRDRAFLLGWTRKEACLKAMGTGLRVDARYVDAGLAARDRLVRVEMERGSVDVAVHSFEAAPGWLAAIARVVSAA